MVVLILTFNLHQLFYNLCWGLVVWLVVVTMMWLDQAFVVADTAFICFKIFFFFSGPGIYYFMASLKGVWGDAIIKTWFYFIKYSSFFFFLKGFDV